MCLRGRSQCAVMFEGEGGKYNLDHHSIQPVPSHCTASISRPMGRWKLPRHEPITGWLQSDEQL